MAYSVKRQRFRMIDREIQLGLAWRMMFAFILFLLAGVIVMFAPSMYRLAAGSKIDELQAAREFLILHTRIWPAVLVTLAGVFAYTLYFSQRIAGPIYRINATLKEMLEGESPEHVILRNGDYFQETADLLQALSRKLAGKQP